MTVCQVGSVAALQDIVRGKERIHVCGNRSKTGLHGGAAEAALVDISPLNGIIDYQPSEYTITVYAGTSVGDIAAALAGHGQYLPFDPLFPGSATIGGTVAANLSGSRRFRYGGVRDFILGAAVVDGLGRAFRVGGKVVKNAAGFDLSKFLVGSLGQYAIMTELTFKVFPDAPRFHSLRFDYKTLDETLKAIYCINQSVFELDALDLAPADDGWSLLARLGGFEEMLPRRAERFSASMARETAPLDMTELEDESTLWDPLAGLTGEFLVKAVLAPKQIPGVDAQIANTRRRYGVGGNLAWVATDDVEALDAALRQLGISGLCLRGRCATPIIGSPADNVLAARVKTVLDPMGKLI